MLEQSTQSQQPLRCILSMKTKPVLCFYTRNHKISHNNFYFYGILIQLLGRTKYTHCAIELDDAYLAAFYGDHARLVPKDMFQNKFGRADLEIELEDKECDTFSLHEYLSTKPKGNKKDVILWFFGLKKNPVTCTSVTCELLRRCGVDVPIYTNPKHLLRWVKQNENDYIWRSR